MGILIFITIMMALEITMEVDQASPKPQVDSQPVETISDQELEALRARKEMLEERYKTLSIELQRLSEFALSKDPEDELRKLREEMEKLQAELEQLNEQVEAIAEAVPKHVEERRRLVEDLGLLEARLTDLELQQQRQRANPKITYILQDGGDKQSIIVEVADSHLAVGLDPEGDGAIWLRDASIDTRLSQLDGILAGRDRAKTAVVLLVKPSAFDSYLPIYERLVEAGFSVGTELILEQATPFPQPDK